MDLEVPPKELVVPPRDLEVPLRDLEVPRRDTLEVPPRAFQGSTRGFPRFNE